MYVRTSADGSEGVALAVDWRPDLILMDLMMPVMDGFEATRVIRSDTRTHDIPIVAYSASPLGSATRRAFEAGAAFRRDLVRKHGIRVLVREMTSHSEPLRQRATTRRRTILSLPTFIRTQ